VCFSLFRSCFSSFRWFLEFLAPLEAHSGFLVVFGELGIWICQDGGILSVFRDFGLRQCVFVLFFGFVLSPLFSDGSGGSRPPGARWRPVAFFRPGAPWGPPGVSGAKAKSKRQKARLPGLGLGLVIRG
jgi:hypothetical protein